MRQILKQNVDSVPFSAVDASVSTAVDGVVDHFQVNIFDRKHLILQLQCVLSVKLHLSAIEILQFTA